jgi:formate-nitrite transporter family protein
MAEEDKPGNADGNPAKKSYHEILQEEMESAQGELERPLAGLALSGLSAGLDVGFSLLFLTAMHTTVHGALPEAVVKLLVIAVYPIGFLFVVLGRSELFTEHTTQAVLPVLGGKAPLRSLARLWAVLYVTNLVGVSLFTALIVHLGPRLGAVQRESFYFVAHPLIHHPWSVVLLSGVLAGWLMGLLSWLVSAGRDTVSQVLIIFIVGGGIGLGQLHHCIVGTAEVLGAVFAGVGVTLGDYGHFLLWATLGNAIGGTVFVALLKYGHVSQEDEGGDKGDEKSEA